MAVTLRSIVQDIRSFDRLAPEPQKRPKPERNDDDHYYGGGGGGYGGSTDLAIRTAVLGAAGGGC